MMCPWRLSIGVKIPLALSERYLILLGASRALSTILQALECLPIRHKQKAYCGVRLRSQAQLPKEPCPAKFTHHQPSYPILLSAPPGSHVPQTTGPLHRLPTSLFTQ